MPPREPSSLRDLAEYVAENADRIVVGNNGRGTRLSDLPTKDALKCMADIVRSGRMPAPPPTTSPLPLEFP